VIRQGYAFAEELAQICGVKYFHATSFKNKITSRVLKDVFDLILAYITQCLFFVSNLN